jgi:hypothetical protein
MAQLGWGPLFVSDVRLRGYKSLPLAAAPWALDSGGFSELQKYGRWTVTPAEYLGRIRRYERQVGQLTWAAPQDWMCEPIIINGGVINGQRFVGTKLSVREHQWRTIDNWCDLDNLRPADMLTPIIKVVQGSTIDDYLRHVDLYRAAGIDLRDEPLVGVGSVCRRQGTDEARQIFQALHDVGVTRLHGFGLKKTGLALSGDLLVSADSMAWSFDARRQPRMEQCQEHKNCANCPRFALQWRRELLTKIGATAA